MDKNKVEEIVQACTRMFAKPGKEGEVLQHDDVLDVEVQVLAPVLTQADQEQHEHLVDCHFVVIAVDIPKAEAHRDAFVDELKAYPEPERLAEGCSYLQLGAVVGSHDVALRVLAVGKALGLWEVVTPAKMGFEGRQADQLAERGMIFNDQFRGG